MDRQPHNSACASPLWDLVAGGLSDPVVRLRFLKFVAPDPLPDRTGRSKWRRLARVAAIPLLMAAILAITLLVRAGAHSSAPRPSTQIEAPVVHTAAPASILIAPAEIWKVEDSRDFETYSNGLRIDNRFTVSNHPRSYLAFPAGEPKDRDGVPASKPAGIVFHTTESRQAPLEERENRVLQRISNSLIEFVQRKRAYHFLIDRFGRVYRIVAESDAANHAGYSVWADETAVYLNLNESFLGVSFEAETQPGQVQASISSAQIRAAAMLTEMLRSRYAIPAANCVTHSQVSVNPSNMRVGYHTDWASSFPFEQLGLPNNYSRPAASIRLFGFEPDSSFLRWAGTQQYSGIESAERQLKEEARRVRMTPEAYRKLLQQRYKRRLATARRGVEADEGNE